MKGTKQSIVIRVPNWVGDAVVSTAILEPIRDYYPDANINIVAKEYVSAVFENNPFIDDIIVFRGFKNARRHIKGDIGIILPNSFSSALLFAISGVKRRVGYRSEARSFLLTEAIPMPSLKEEHLIENYKRIVTYIFKDVKGATFIPKIFLNREMNAGEILKKFGINKTKGIVIIDPGSAYGPAKIWLPSRYAKVIDFIMKEKGYTVVMLGSKDAEGIVQKITEFAEKLPVVLTGKLSLREAIYVISTARLFISPDTGGMHIAAALGTPQVAIFGSSSPVWTRPLNPRSRVIYKSLPCSPCFKRRCPLGTYECLKSITSEDVIEKINELI